MVTSKSRFIEKPKNDGSYGNVRTEIDTHCTILINHRTFPDFLPAVQQASLLTFTVYQILFFLFQNFYTAYRNVLFLFFFSFYFDRQNGHLRNESCSNKLDNYFQPREIVSVRATACVLTRAKFRFDASSKPKNDAGEKRKKGKRGEKTAIVN